MKSAWKYILILFLIGTLVSSQQVSSESVFTQKKHLDFDRLVIGPPDFAGKTNPVVAAAYADTLETFDIEVEDESERNVYKEIAIFLIVGAAVGYVVYLLIKPDEEDSGDTNGGKEPPITQSVGVSIPLTR